MSAVITPYVQPNTGIAVFKVDKKTADYINFGGGRFTLSKIPRGSADDVQDGVLDKEYSLATSELLADFFASDAVFKALGGENGCTAWATQDLHECQAPRDYLDCCNNTIVQCYNGSALRLCWTHDNEYMMKGYGRLNDVLVRNRANWILSMAAIEMQLPDDRDLSMIELVFWAINRGLRDELPVDAGRISLCLEPETVPTGTLKESDIVQGELSVRQLVDKMADEVIKVGVNEDSGLLYMARPKILLGKSQSYSRFVATQPCVGCGNSVRTPFMYHTANLNPHCRWQVPLCDTCAHEAAQDLVEWQRSHDVRLYQVANQLFDFAIERGVITFEN